MKMSARKRVKWQSQEIMEYMFTINEGTLEKVAFSNGALSIALDIPMPSVRRCINQLKENHFLTGTRIAGVVLPPTEEQLTNYFKHKLNKGRKQYKLEVEHHK